MCSVLVLPLRTRHADIAFWASWGFLGLLHILDSKAVSEEQLLSNSESHRATGLDPETYLVNTQQNCSKDL